MEALIHRFKMSLRTNLKIWKDDLNLICISGGSNSMALLDLMHQALFGVSTQTQRKMFFKVHVIYVDEGRAIYGWSEEEHAKNIKMITEMCQTKYNFTFTVVPLEAIFDVQSEVVELKQPSAEQKLKLEEEKKNDFDHHTELDQELFE